MKRQSGPYIVKYADFNFTDLVDHNNQYHKAVPIGIAKQMAKDANLELVCFTQPSSKSGALCKIIDFGKWKYNNDKKAKKQSKEHKKVTKEIRFSPVISDNDVSHKIKQALKFLDEDDDVIFSMRLKGRQRAHFKEAEERMNEILKLCDGHGEEVSRKKSSSMIIVRFAKPNKVNKK